MNIAVFVGMFPKISETFIVNQIIGLLSRGHDVTIIASETAEKEIQTDVKEHGLLEKTRYPESLQTEKTKRCLKFALDWFNLFRRKPSRAFACLRLAFPFDFPGMQRFYLARVFEDLDVDVVHCHFGFVGAIAANLKSRGLIRCPILTSYHGIDIGSCATPEKYEQLHSRGNHFTVNSAFSANRAVELGCPIEQISLLPVGLRLTDFPFQERYHLPHESLRLLTVVRLIKSKGVHIALEAVSQLVEQGFAIHFNIVGDGPEREALERQVKELRLTDHVTFHGALLRSDVIACFKQAELFVLPSLSFEKQDSGLEGQGLVLQEAQAMGLPVIASHCCGIPEGILDGESGLLFPDGDATALAQCIQQLYDCHHLWPEFGRAGRNLVESKFDIELLTDRLVDIYENALKA